MKVKLCGFTESASLLTAIDCGIDFLGFVFYEKSPRNISLEQAAKLSLLVPSAIKKVAVLVNPSLNFLEKIVESLQPQYFQLHGQETVAQVLAIKNTFPAVKIIKSFSITKKQDLEQSLDFAALADIFLFDNSSGGSGKCFDFHLLQNFSCNKEWFLAGGLNSSNILEALKISGAKLVDISSGIEKERGKKSPELIIELMTKIKNAA